MTHFFLPCRSQNDAPSDYILYRSVDEGKSQTDSQTVSYSTPRIRHRAEPQALQTASGSLHPRSGNPYPIDESKIKKVVLPNPIQVPDNPFILPEKPIQTFDTDEIKPRANENSHSSYNSSNSPQFAAPQTPEIPEWLKLSMHNHLEPDVDHPRVKAAKNADQLHTETAQDFAKAGYPSNIIAEQIQYERHQMTEPDFRNSGARHANPAPYPTLRTAVPPVTWQETATQNAVPKISAYQNPYQVQRNENPRKPSVDFSQVQQGHSPVQNSSSSVPQRSKRKKTSSNNRFLAFAAILLLLGGIFVAAMFGNRTVIQAKALAHQNNLIATAQSLRTQHPIKYRKLIETKAQKYGLQPAFVAAIILNESSYNPKATSSVGARGLMQCMDSTAQWIWDSIKPEGSYNFDLLYDETTNIEFGCWYLNYLSKLFRGDSILVAAAFHAGQGEIKNWLSNQKYSADGVTIPWDKLPEGPTKKYVSKVIKAYAVYQDLYRESN